MGYLDKPSSPRGSSSIVLSVLAVHMRTSQRPGDNMSATAVKATEQNHYDIIVPRNNGQMYEQPTSHIPRESHSVRIEMRHQMTLKKPVPALHSPLMARRCLENVPWLAGIGLQSPMEAGSAFL